MGHGPQIGAGRADGGERKSSRRRVQAALRAHSAETGPLRRARATRPDVIEEQSEGQPQTARCARGTQIPLLGGVALPPAR